MTGAEDAARALLVYQASCMGENKSLNFESGFIARINPIKTLPNREH